jgi:hypothetical protein
MSATELLAVTKAAGIALNVVGDRLRYSASKGALTPELRDAMARHKAELLILLAPVTFITLKGGLVVPRQALELALDLEQRGYRQRVDVDGLYQVEPLDTLTRADRTAILRWRLHLAAIVAYEAPKVG